MDRAPIAKIPKEERQELLDNLNYLNTAEIKSFCKRHSIPYAISIEGDGGRKRRTQDDDRKGVMLHRVRHFLETGMVLEGTCLPASVVCSGALPKKLTAGDRLFYGQYDKESRVLLGLLKDLTAEQFRNGAIARILLREFWSRGEAPTLKEFASAWLQASREHTKPNPEWAFLSDRASKGTSPDWKRQRAETAAKVMGILDRIAKG